MCIRDRLGSNFIPSANHAGGLRYHGMSSILSQLYHDGYMEARSVEQTSVFEAAEQFARVEGILPAPDVYKRQILNRAGIKHLICPG